MNTLYMIEHISSKKCYIGYTSQEINGYWKKHITNSVLEVSSGKTGRPFYNALAKYGPDKFNWSIIQIFNTTQEAKQAEMYWIEELKKIGIVLYNRTSGGDGMSGYIPSIEDKQIRRNNMIGDKNHFYGKKHSKETIRKISNNKKGKSPKEETIKKMKIAHKGENNSNSKLSEQNILEILELLKTNIRQVEIAKRFNVCNSTISYIKLGKSWKI